MSLDKLFECLAHRFVGKLEPVIFGSVRLVLRDQHIFLQGTIFASYAAPPTLDPPTMPWTREFPPARA
jgi:hypothetical protein